MLPIERNYPRCILIKKKKKRFLITSHQLCVRQHVLVIGTPKYKAAYRNVSDTSEFKVKFKIIENVYFRTNRRSAGRKKTIFLQAVLRRREHTPATDKRFLHWKFTISLLQTLRDFLSTLGRCQTSRKPPWPPFSCTEPSIPSLSDI